MQKLGSPPVWPRPFSANDCRDPLLKQCRKWFGTGIFLMVDRIIRAPLSKPLPFMPTRSRRCEYLGHHGRAFEHGLVENVLLIDEHEIKLLVLVHVRVQHDQHRRAGFRR